MSTGENIKSLRTGMGWTQEELAEKLGVRRSMIAQIERGTKCASMELGKQIAKLFGCTLDDLGK